MSLLRVEICNKEEPLFVRGKYRRRSVRPPGTKGTGKIPVYDKLQQKIVYIPEATWREDRERFDRNIADYTRREPEPNGFYVLNEEKPKPQFKKQPINYIPVIDQEKESFKLVTKEQLDHDQESGNNRYRPQY